MTSALALPGAGLSGRLFVLASSLLGTALLFDLADVATGTGALALPAYWLAAAGVLAGAAAGLSRLWRMAPAVRRSPWRLTASPGFFRAVAIALYAGGWSLRTVQGDVPAAGLALGLAGAGFALAARFLPPPVAMDGEQANDGGSGALRSPAAATASCRAVVEPAGTAR